MNSTCWQTMGIDGRRFGVSPEYGGRNSPVSASQVVCGCKRDHLANLNYGPIMSRGGITGGLLPSVQREYAYLNETGS